MTLTTNLPNMNKIFLSIRELWRAQTVLQKSLTGNGSTDGCKADCYIPRTFRSGLKSICPTLQVCLTYDCEKSKISKGIFYVSFFTSTTWVQIPASAFEQMFPFLVDGYCMCSPDSSIKYCIKFRDQLSILCQLVYFITSCSLFLQDALH